MHKLNEAYEYHTSFYGPDGLYPIPGWSYEKWFNLLYDVVLIQNPELYESIHQNGAGESIDREQMKRHFCEYYNVQPGKKTYKANHQEEMLADLLRAKAEYLGLDLSVAEQLIQSAKGDIQLATVLMEQFKMMAK